jgi:hypothetical protein
MNNLLPPFFDGSVLVPSYRVDVLKAKPKLQLLPNSPRKAAFEEKMGGRLLPLIAKFTKPTIWPSSTS